MNTSQESRVLETMLSRPNGRGRGRMKSHRSIRSHEGHDSPTSGDLG